MVVEDSDRKVVVVKALMIAHGVVVALLRVEGVEMLRLSAVAGRLRRLILDKAGLK